MLTVGKMLYFTSECINEKGEYFISGNGFRLREISIIYIYAFTDTPTDSKSIRTAGKIQPLK